MNDDFIPRIVYEDSVSVYADGSSQTTWQEAQLRYDFDYIPQKPLLVINSSEASPEGIKKLIKEGYYKKLFCDVDRVREIELICKKNGLNFNTYFKVIFNSTDDLFNEFTTAHTDAEKQTILEKHYDSKLAALSPEKIHASVKENFVEHMGFTKFLTGAAKVANVLSRSTKLFPPVGNFVIDRLAEISRERQEKEHWFRKEYASIPEYIRNVLEKIGVQFIVTDNHENSSTLGRSDYTTGSIYVQTKSIRTLSEEMIHQVDSFLGFSEKYNWKRAVSKDATPDNKTLAKYYTNDNKASLFDGGGYSPGDRPAEVLADMYNMLRMNSQNYPNIESDFPRTMPLFKQFIVEVKKISEEFKVEKLNKEAQANPERHQFSKRLNAQRKQSNGNNRSLGSERTEPKPRTSWVKTVTP